jgi:G3E family GTPase
MGDPASDDDDDLLPDPGPAPARQRPILRARDGEDPVPLIILSGFLGAGKTTVLNRVLGVPPRWRLAVVVNELGRIDVDGKLLRARKGDVIELPGGCVCHEVRTQQELWTALEEVLARARPDRLVLETTGIAEPQAIVDGLDALGRRDPAVVVRAVVTVVDAEAGLGQLQRHSEARAQVAMADRLILSKLDRTDPERLAALHKALDELNAEAERAAFPPGEDGARDLYGWLLADGAARPARAVAPAPHAHGQLVAAAFAHEQPLVGEPLLALCDRLGSALVRVKGFVDLAGEDRRGFLERAGSSTSLRLGDPWPAGPRRTELVFIGEGLDPAALRRELLACGVGAPG